MKIGGLFVFRFLIIFLFSTQLCAVNDEWFKAIDLALKNGKTEMLETLYQKNNNIVNVKNDKGQTALHYFVSAKDPTLNLITWILKKNNTDVNVKDKELRPPFSWDFLFDQTKNKIICNETISLLCDRGIAFYKRYKYSNSNSEDILAIDYIKNIIDDIYEYEIDTVLLGFKRAASKAILYGDLKPLLCIIRNVLKKNEYITESKNKSFLADDFFKSSLPYQYIKKNMYDKLNQIQHFFMVLLRAKKENFQDPKITKKELWEAIYCEHTAKALELLECMEKNDIENEKDSNGDTPLMWAARAGNLLLLAYIVKKCDFSKDDVNRARNAKDGNFHALGEDKDYEDFKKNDEELLSNVSKDIKKRISKEYFFLSKNNRAQILSKAFEAFMEMPEGDSSYDISRGLLYAPKPLLPLLDKKQIVVLQEKYDKKIISTPIFFYLKSIIFSGNVREVKSNLKNLEILLKNASWNDVLTAEKIIHSAVLLVQRETKKETKNCQKDLAFYFSVLFKEIKASWGGKVIAEVKDPLNFAMTLLKAKLLSLASQLGTSTTGENITTKAGTVSPCFFFKENPAAVIKAFATATKINGMSLTNVISAYVSGANFDDINDMANKYATDKTWEENKIANDMFKKWGRNASSRVFYDHARAFGEIIANAFDAMLPPGDDIGKFGMGFFSILSYLSLKEGNFDGGTTMELETTFAFKKGENISYKLVFEKKDEEVVPRIQFFEMPSKLETGTTISIKPKKKNQKFPKEFLQRIKKYIHYFDFFRPLGMEVSYNNGTNKSETFHVGAYSAFEGAYPVTVTVTPDLLQVTDKGIGISLETCRESLLVPSVSTKGAIDFEEKRREALATPICAKVVDFKGREDKTKAHFLIAVNGVVVVNCPIESIEKRDQEKESQHFEFGRGLKAVKFDEKRGEDILISMPKVTQVSLARDDINIFSGNHFEEQYIKKVIAETMKTFLENEISLSTGIVLGHKIFSNFYHGLKSWEEISANTYIRGLFTYYFRNMLDEILANNENIIPCPYKYVNQFKTILDDCDDHSYSLLPLDDEMVNYSFNRLENRIKKRYKKKLESEMSDENTLAQKALNGGLFNGFNIVFINKNCLEAARDEFCLDHNLGLQNLIFLSNTFFNVEQFKTNGEAIVGGGLTEENLIFVIKDRVDDPRLHCALTGEQKIKKTIGILSDSTIENFKDFNLSWVLPCVNALWLVGEFKYKNVKLKTVEEVEGIIDSVKSCIVLYNDSDKNKPMCDLVRVLLGLLSQYYNVHRIAHVNGGFEKIKAEKPNDDVSSGEILSFLNERNDTIKKLLLTLQLTDFVEKTNVLNHNDSPGRLIVPTIMANTVFSVLTKLYKSNVNSDIIDLIILKAGSYQNLLFFCNVILTDDDFLKDLGKELNSDEKKVIACAAIRHVLEYVIPSLLTENKIKDICKESQRVVKDRESFFKGIPECCFIINFIKRVLDSKEMAWRVHTFWNQYEDIIEKEKRIFSLQKNLIPAHARGKGLDCADYKSTMDIILSQKAPKFKLGKVTQAIEAGSDKDYVQGTLLETFQNSVDAIKDYLKTNKVREKIATIDYTLGFIEKENKRQICLSIADHVGMASLKIILANLILPDYSEKTPAAGNVGDMGNGLFKIFQQAERVSVVTRLTSNDTLMYILDVFPVRDEISHLAGDLNLKLVEIKKDENGFEKDFYGTAIHIQFLPKEKEEATKEMLYIKDLIEHMLSFASVDCGKNQRLALTFNGKEVLKIHLKNVYENSDTMSKDFTIKQCVDKTQFIPSLITTGGVPFRHFGAFSQAMSFLPVDLISGMNFNFIINVSEKMYEPVQSRTKIQMTQKNKKNFKEFLLDSRYEIAKLHNEFASAVSSAFYAPAGVIYLSAGMRRMGYGPFNNKEYLKRIDDFLNNETRFYSMLNEFLIYYRPQNASYSAFDYIKEIWPEGETYSDTENDQKIKLFNLKNINDVDKNFISSYILPNIKDLAKKNK